MPGVALARALGDVAGGLEQADARARRGEPRGDRAAEHPAADHGDVEPGHATSSLLRRHTAEARGAPHRASVRLDETVIRSYKVWITASASPILPEPHVRRDRRRRTLRRLADRHAARPRGPSRAARRPGHVPERHALDALHPPARRGRAGPLGPAAGGRRLGLPGDPPTTASTSARSRCRARPRRSATSTPRTPSAAPSWTRSCSTARPPPASRCARASPSTSCCSSRPGRRHRRPLARRRAGHRAGPARDRRGRDGLAGGARRRRAHLRRSSRALTCAYYTYWRGVEMDGRELYPRDGRMIIASPTNGGEVVTIVFWPNAEFARVRADLERDVLAAVLSSPRTWPSGSARGERSDRFRGTVRLPNFFREASGPGWALVGDAGHHKDPILALGISDALPRRRAAGRRRRRRSRRARAAGQRARAATAAGATSSRRPATPARCSSPACSRPGPSCSARFAALCDDQERDEPLLRDDRRDRRAGGSARRGVISRRGCGSSSPAAPAISARRSCASCARRAPTSLGLDVLASPSTDVVGSIADRGVRAARLEGVDAVLHTATLHKPHVGSHARADFVEVERHGHAEPARGGGRGRRRGASCSRARRARSVARSSRRRARRPPG